ncbi:hypothetical protein PpBr36_02006 [Pyricularia pennisetigena]|uniref:hypothetical protein n=1 Tax=Pyricularia pennisetigena TaxID=1578925 RepID=UPI001154389B|nr:hypothetical protein PpBr36_02006 [Pyricularia pennisetigena]TLS27951.1 hypothetical protein PpBr36_02006 [Pyricularia pennisetigena]
MVDFSTFYFLSLSLSVFALPLDVARGPETDTSGTMHQLPGLSIPEPYPRDAQLQEAEVRTVKESHAATPRSAGSEPQALERPHDEGRSITKRVVRRFDEQQNPYNQQHSQSYGMYGSSGRPASSYYRQNTNQPPFLDFPQPSDGRHKVFRDENGAPVFVSGDDHRQNTGGQPPPASSRRYSSGQTYVPSGFSREQNHASPSGFNHYRTSNRAPVGEETPSGTYPRGRSGRNERTFLPLDRGDGKKRPPAPSPPLGPRRAWMEEESDSENRKTDPTRKQKAQTGDRSCQFIKVK